MSVLAKLLLTVAADKRFWKVVASILVGVFMLFIIPGGIFQGTSSAIGNMDQDLLEDMLGMEIDAIETNCEQIRTFFSSAGIAASSPKAQIIYMVYLTDQNVDDAFLTEYCDCFLAGINEDAILVKIKNKYGVEVSKEVVAKYLPVYQQIEPPVEKFTNPGTVNCRDFVTFVTWAQTNYWWCLDGTYGVPVTDSILQKYAQAHPTEWQQYGEYIQSNLKGFHTVDDVGLYLAYCELISPGSTNGRDGIHNLTGSAAYQSATVKGSIDTFRGPAGASLLATDGRVWYYLGGGRVVTAGNPKEGIIYDYYRTEDYTGWFYYPDMEYQ